MSWQRIELYRIQTAVRFLRWGLMVVAVLSVGWLVRSYLQAWQLGPSYAAGAALKAPVQEPCQPIASKVDRAVILAHDLFASYDGPNDLVATSEPPWSIEQKGLVLVGTVTGQPDLCRAIFWDENSRQTISYKLKDQICGAQIEQINRDSVVVRHAARSYIIRRPESTGTLPVYPSNSRSQILPPNKAGQVGYKDLVGGLLRDATIRPFSDGLRQGIRIEDLDKVANAKELGLSEGDVIETINGQGVYTPQKAFEVLRKSRSVGCVQIGLDRAGQQKRIYIGPKGGFSDANEGS